MSKPNYRERFIYRNTLTLPACKCQAVVIEPKVARLIKSLSTSANISISGFITNVLMDHIERYRPEILAIINESITALDSEFKDL